MQKPIKSIPKTTARAATTTTTAIFVLRPFVASTWLNLTQQRKYT
jgi:hypothetical protein